MSYVKYPDYYPQGCPPEPQDPKDGIYYHLVSSEDAEPTDEDIEPRCVRLGWSIKWEKCPQAALSMFEDLQDARITRDWFPKLPQFIGTFKIIGFHGVIHHTPTEIAKSHHDWWVPTSENPKELWTGSFV